MRVVGTRSARVCSCIRMASPSRSAGSRTSSGWRSGGDGLLLRQSDHLDPAVGQHLLINDRTAIGGMTS
jgi:hypothetical protein